MMYHQLRQLWFVCLAFDSLSSWTVYAQPGRLTGYVDGLGNCPVVFAYKQHGVDKQDTVWAKQDRFVYAPQPSDDGLIGLRISRPRSTSFWYEPGTITVRGTIGKPYKLTVTGGPENNTFTAYHHTIQWAYEDRAEGQSDSVKTLLSRQERQATLAFIKQHPAARTSAHLLYWDTLVGDDHPVDLYQQLLRELSPAVRGSSQGRQVAQRISILINQPVVGSKAPTFALADTSGKLISTASYGGTYILLDFWGHWCTPCLRAFPKLKALHEHYSGKVTLIGVAAEFAADKALWLRTIKTHHLPGIQISELKADKGEVNDQYNITAFPTYLLINKQGIVVARALDLETIETKLATLTDL